ncbi:N-acetylglucosamine-6-phosphate deacetylase [Terriglobus roseus DSM 18391]|uniref:N-acetylglucosamine-6-phosphate deacetylase n=1 Tax=Terriglobus roseus (strain DSM 18391 / NRRL B-41598 / KBS 63) TaxID=926566 RepID=I3ZIW9_TERRK|nr:amidohydrolase family protein [Terriglobus roseus]AFL89187.1 N-acetylglucosamine-6-phosphate deacetylase [Terriglobus roseus DSM 18391]
MSSVRNLRGRDALTLETIEIEVLDTRVASIRPYSGNVDDLWLAPGLVDLQVNGYGGIDLNAAACDAQAIERLTLLLASRGTTAYLPTVITAAHPEMESRLRTIAEARRNSTVVAHAVPGVHLEGPSISPIDGYRGAHAAEHVRPPSLTEFESLQVAADGLIKLVTLSPHWPDVATYIRALRDRGVTVALGHTHASPEQICAAVDAGAQLSTHLGNGIAAELPRHPNPIWTQLAEDRLTATFIADGVHLPADVLRVMLRAKGIERSVLVSDSVALAGSKPGLYHSPIGGDVIVGADGSVRMRDTGLLAGSGIALKDAVALAAGLPGSSLRDAVRMATEIPGGFLNAPCGRLAVGSSADLLLFRWSAADDTLALIEVLVEGRSMLALQNN